MSDAKRLFSEIKMPTPEEHRAVSLAWLARIQQTLIDQWPAEMAALSMPTRLIRIDAAAVFTAICDLHDRKDMDQVLLDLADELDAAIGWDRKFIRLNSRSPKDNIWPYEVPATLSGKEAVSMLAGSERVIDDLMEFQYVPEQPAYICLRDHIWWIRSENEFRCFVKDGKLVAVTHYDYTKPVPEAFIARGAEIRHLIDVFFEDRMRQCIPVKTLVFDVAMNTNDGSLMLIEINPYGRSDPCWFGSYEAVENAREPIQFNFPDAGRAAK